MSTYGVISDIHGNLEALEAALAFLRSRGVDELLCLGDIVGYCGDSNACVEVVRGRGMTAVAGNHDLISLGQLGLERCSDKAAFALRRTRRELDAASRVFLATLPRTLRCGDIALAHGSFFDPGEYLRTPVRVSASAEAALARYPGLRVCFYGHTHEPKVWEVRPSAVVERPAERTILDAPDALYLVNPGSVDASRKAGPKLAELAIYDDQRRALEFHAVGYDAEATERRAAQRGFRMGVADVWAYRGLRSARRLARLL
jgi:predicted phosphodiesterase